MSGDIRARFERLYTGAVADVLDAGGYRHQVLPSRILPLTLSMKVAGTAFPGFGVPTEDPSDNDMDKRLAMLESIPPESVTVWSCAGHTGSAHWGEMMSRSVMQRGCVGAVVDGGLRDTQAVLELGFPVWCSLRSPASSIGRWNIVDWNCPIVIGETTINPGDWVFGDADGVVVVPRDIALDVLAHAETRVATEREMREDLARGLSVTEAFTRHRSM
jgi:4-hydroxy-4-methyl-2-oxoglutarate aldolase